MHTLVQLEALVMTLDPRGTPTAKWVRRVSPTGRRIGVLSASFNPLTNAHIAMVEGAVAEYRLDEVVLVLAKANVDKEVFGATLAQRLDMLQHYCVHRPQLGIVAASHGRFTDKLATLQQLLSADLQFFFLLGYDTLVRLFDSKYYEDPARELNALFAECEFIAANRGEQNVSAVEDFMNQPSHRQYASRVHPLRLNEHHARISSSQVRELLVSGKSVRHLIPSEIQTYLTNTPIYGPPSNH